MNDNSAQYSAKSNVILSVVMLLSIAFFANCCFAKCCSDDNPAQQHSCKEYPYAVCCTSYCFAECNYAKCQYENNSTQEHSVRRTIVLTVVKLVSVSFIIVYILNVVMLIVMAPYFSSFFRQKCQNCNIRFVKGRGTARNVFKLKLAQKFLIGEPSAAFINFQIGFKVSRKIIKFVNGCGISDKKDLSKASNFSNRLCCLRNFGKKKENKVPQKQKLKNKKEETKFSQKNLVTTC